MNQITIDEIRSNPDIAIDELFESGAFVIPQLIHTETASALKDRCLRVEDSYIQKGGKTDINGSVISHPFLYDSEFYKYVEIPEICDLIERCIGDSIILVNANINNRQISKGLSGNTAPGVGWHTDSRYVQKGKGDSRMDLDIFCVYVSIIFQKKMERPRSLKDLTCSMKSRPERLTQTNIRLKQ